MSLQARLDAYRAETGSEGAGRDVPTAYTNVMDRITNELIAAGATKRALKVGATAPPFSLQDPDGNVVSSPDLLAEGLLVLSFYRGVWCPYCNMELQALQAVLPRIRAAGARLVAISPQTPENSLESVRQNELGFPILSDPGNSVAAAFGLRFQMPDYLVDLYKSLKNDLPRFNGDRSWTLPMPGRFVIGPDQRVLYAEVSADHTRRPEPEMLLPVLTMGRVG